VLHVLAGAVQAAAGGAGSDAEVFGDFLVGPSHDGLKIGHDGLVVGDVG
jgi:hypothetical protein